MDLKSVVVPHHAIKKYLKNELVPQKDTLARFKEHHEYVKGIKRIKEQMELGMKIKVCPWVRQDELGAKYELEEIKQRPMWHIDCELTGIERAIRLTTRKIKFMIYCHNKNRVKAKEYHDKLNAELRQQLEDMDEQMEDDTSVIMHQWDGDGDRDVSHKNQGAYLQLANYAKIEHEWSQQVMDIVFG